MADTTALFRRFPALAGRLGWLRLGSGVTPVERVEGAELPGELWVKRDDLTGPEYGGNKLRKLEFLLAHARQRGAGRLVTGGGFGSHHALATTLYGTRAGFAVTAVLYPQQATAHVREVLAAIHGLGADLRYCPHMALLPASLALARRAGRRDVPYAVPPGGSSPVGVLGYVSAGLELAEQVSAGAAPAPDHVHVAAGTLGTAAGLAIGFALGGLRGRIVGVKIVPDYVASERVLRRLVRATLALLADTGDAAVRAALPAPAEVAARVQLRGGYLGDGYGRPTTAGAAALERFGALGLGLDPTYTAKTAAALLDALERAPGVHLFWHTLSAVMPAVPRAAALPDRFRRRLGP
ncbi:MAG TPA: pyridoxal-phosphate dependent enzyme [Longimicrobiales bacterium]|nr:pyridoxal-phosphate dependent enzyme [Longimicrobiales bacterium]